MASSMLPLASVSAALHSIMPAPVMSRSFLTVAAVICHVISSYSLQEPEGAVGTRSASCGTRTAVGISRLPASSSRIDAMRKNAGP